MSAIDFSNRILVMDGENKGLLPDLRHGCRQDAHVIVARDVITDEEFIWFDPYDMRDPEHRASLGAWEGKQTGDLEDGIRALKQCSAIVSQNFIGYDGPAYEKLFPHLFKGFNYLEARGKDRPRSDLCMLRTMDTLILSRFLNPDRKLPPQAYAMGLGNIGPHTIAAHGIRMKRYKPDHEDWSTLTLDMLHRCREDVVIGRDFFLWLMGGEWLEHKARGPNARTGIQLETAFRMESQIALEMTRQELRGFPLDMDKAVARCAELDGKIDATIANFRPHMPKRLVTKPMKPADRVKMADNANAWLQENSNHLAADSKLLDHSDFLYAERKGSAETNWAPATKSGAWSAKVQKLFPWLRGNVNDTPEFKRVGPYSPVEWEDIPLGNRDVVKELLYPLGWRGVVFNDTDQDYMEEHGELPKPWSGKLDEKSMEAWAEAAANEGYAIPEWCQGIAEWYIFSSRRGQILNRQDVEYYDANKQWPSHGGNRKCRGFLPVAFNKQLGITAQQFYETYGRWPHTYADDGEWRVPAVAVSIGTNTFRMRHKNVVNIPARGWYPLRDLFIASKGKMILGCDGAGLELRVLAHFMNDQEYTDIVLHGDIHSHNMNKAGLPKRDMAKTFILIARMTWE